MTQTLKKYGPGILLVTTVYILSNLLNSFLNTTLNFSLGVLTTGIILGIIINNFITIKDNYRSGIRFSLKKLLKIGIILLGFKINFYDLVNLGPKILLMVLVQVPFVILTAMLLGKVFNINHKLSTLIGVGTAVCGTSAIVAIAPVIDSDESDAILSVSIVSFLGAIGVLAYSFINNFVHPNVLHYGIWSGISLHGVAHAIAAAVAGGDQSLKIATFVKMSRVVMLVPVSVILAGVFNKDNSDNNRAKFPMYVLYFIIVGLMNTFLTLPTNITGIFKTTSSLLIAMAMIAMGLSVDLKSIKNKGIQSITLATTVFIIISSLSYLVIYLIV